MADRSRSEGRPAWPRRGFPLSAAALVAGPPRAVRGSASAADLPGFPEGVDVYRSACHSWVGEITADGLWACAPGDADQVFQVVNWAWKQGWTVRARVLARLGAADDPRRTKADARVLLVDAAGRLTGLSLESTQPAAVRAGAGVTLETPHGFLEDHGLGLSATPAPGDLTLGGAPAIDAHGTAVPADGESSGAPRPTAVRTAAPSRPPRMGHGRLAGCPHAARPVPRAGVLPGVGALPCHDIRRRVRLHACRVVRACTDQAAWSDPEVLGSAVPASFDDGEGADWDATAAVPTRPDPHRVFDSAPLKQLVP